MGAISVSIRFKEIYELFCSAIARREALEKKGGLGDSKLDKEERQQWAQDEEELLLRLGKIKRLQVDSLEKIALDEKEHILQRIEKYRKQLEDKALEENEGERPYFYVVLLKSIASALDEHTKFGA